MEHLLRLLPAGPQPLLVRYGTTTVIVAICFLLLMAVHAEGAVFGFYLLHPAIFLASIIFDRGSGFYATGLCALLLYFFMLPAGTWLLPGAILLPLMLFVLISLAIATFSEGLRKAWERAVQAEETKDLLLRELGHRTVNNLNMVIAVLTLQRRAQTNPEARAALESALLRVKAIAEAHNHFRPLRHQGVVEMRGYLEQLCAYIENNLRDIRPIAVRVRAEEMSLKSETAAPLGLIVNELVTNALKHAFPENRAGLIEVKLVAGPPLVLSVADDGVGYCDEKKQNLGTQLICRLVAQLGGKIAWENQKPGCRVVVVLGQA
jgi:two-component system, sensor histidine kinase PdtaS